jgi:hypothetical protein
MSMMAQNETTEKLSHSRFLYVGIIHALNDCPILGRVRPIEGLRPTTVGDGV